ncbi:MAG: HEPN domain-containing protein [Aureliella sp.]
MPREEYDSFLKSLAMAEALLELERASFSNPPKKDERDSVQGLRGGAVVLMVASFEYYLRSLMAAVVEDITSGPNAVEFGDLPDQMQVTSIFEGLQLATKGARYGPPPPKKDRIPEIKTICSKILAGNVIHQAFSDTSSNPNSQVVKGMFKNLGIRDVFSEIKRKFETRGRWNGAVADTFISDKLDEIVANRHVVAHTAKTLDLTRSDLKESIKFLRILAELLALKANKHIESLRST